MNILGRDLLLKSCAGLRRQIKGEVAKYCPLFVATASKNCGCAFLQHRNDLALCKSTFLQGNLRLREAPKFYRLVST